MSRFHVRNRLFAFQIVNLARNSVKIVYNTSKINFYGKSMKLPLEK